MSISHSENDIVFLTMNGIEVANGQKEVNDFRAKCKMPNFNLSDVTKTEKSHTQILLFIALWNRAKQS